MGSQFHSLALVSIRKAVKLEPDIKQIPKYLELEGHIESSIGKKDMALQSFLRAVKIIKEKQKLFLSSESKDLEKRIVLAIKELEKT